MWCTSCFHFQQKNYLQFQCLGVLFPVFFCARLDVKDGGSFINCRQSKSTKPLQSHCNAFIISLFALSSQCKSTPHPMIEVGKIVKSEFIVFESFFPTTMKDTIVPHWLNKVKHDSVMLYIFLILALYRYILQSR
jgi:hypothetical protein